MSFRVVALESENDGSVVEPLHQNWNMESWNNAEAQQSHLVLTQEKAQIDETLSIEQHIIESPNSIKNLHVNPRSFQTDFMSHEPEIAVPASLPQESPSFARDAAAHFTNSTRNVAQNRWTHSPSNSFCQTSQVVSENIPQQLHGSHVLVTTAPEYQSQQTPQPDQLVGNGYHAPDFELYFPPFRQGYDAASAAPVMSTTTAHNFMLSTSDGTCETTQVSQNIGQEEAGPSLVSRNNNEAAITLTHCTEGDGPDALILATYRLEGFRYTKVWLQNPEECPYCDEEFANGKSLDEHIKRKHRNDLNALHEPVEKVKCPHCDLFLMSETNLRRHVANVHSEEKAKVSCERCSASFSSSFAIVIHMRDVHGIQPASRLKNNGVRKKKKVFFRCEACGYCSKEKSNVTRHVRSAHVGKRIPVQG